MGIFKIFDIFGQLNKIKTIHQIIAKIIGRLKDNDNGCIVDYIDR